VTDPTPRPPAPLAVAALFAALFVVYNANGREVGTYDSQPAKFTAREIAVTHTLVLDRVIAQFPQLADRPAFARDLAGHTRSAYPILPALIAAIPATLGEVTGVVDMDAPGAPNLMAALTASLLTAGAVALVFVSLVRLVRPRVAAFAAIALGLGTNYWTFVSRTLWAHETVAFGLALALWAWLRPGRDITARDAAWGGVGLALAGAARPQLAPLIALMLGWLLARAAMRRALLASAIIAAAAMIAIAANVTWFGHVFGATPALYSPQETVAHGTSGPFNPAPWVGAAGLLISPSRGLLVFSPVWIAAIAGLGRAWRADHALGLRWLMAAAGVQFIAYSSFSVWWGGHTFGPRYVLDLLVPLAPAFALGAERWLAKPSTTWPLRLLLAWSIGVAALGAFVYPNDGWNTDPDDVDRNHARLWQVSDSQILRALHQPFSPQNFDLFTRAAVRRPQG
jgi:hypothetical protein